jgi:hypothetical protein
MSKISSKENSILQPMGHSADKISHSGRGKQLEINNRIRFTSMKLTVVLVSMTWFILCSIHTYLLDARPCCAEQLLAKLTAVLVSMTCFILCSIHTYLLDARPAVWSNL